MKNEMKRVGLMIGGGGREPQNNESLSTLHSSLVLLPFFSLSLYISRAIYI